jgi:hypothetical protein
MSTNSTTTARPASIKQLSYIRTLLLERAAALGFDSADIDAVVAVYTADLTTRGASQAIDALLAIPAPRAEVTLSPERQQAIAVLREHARALPARDQAFAASLLAHYDRRGDLSPRQWPHAERLAATLAEVVERVARETALTAPTVALADRVGATRGAIIRVVVPGAVMGTDGTTDPAYIVSLSPSRPGVQRESGSVGTTRLSDLGTVAAQRVLEHLLALDDEALTEAQAQYGRAFGRCGRCGSPLSTDASKAAGLGPECASKL